MTSPRAKKATKVSSGAKPTRRIRRREAQLWVDMARLRSSTRVVSVHEGFQIWSAAKDQLQVDDPELFEVVQALLDDISRTDPLLTREEWRVRAVARCRRVERLRARLARCA